MALSGRLWIPRAFRLPAFASWPSCARCGLARSYDEATGSQTLWGFHVPHRQATSGELASLRREPGTVSAGPLTPIDHRSTKDVSTPYVPFLHDDASTKASHAFNSIPTFPRIDFGWGSLLSFCVYGLLETPRLPPTPRPYGNRRSVLAWSAVTSFRIQTLDLCDLVSH